MTGCCYDNKGRKKKAQIVLNGIENIFIIYLDASKKPKLI